MANLRKTLRKLNLMNSGRDARIHARNLMNTPAQKPARKTADRQPATVLGIAERLGS